ncbi:MAG: hypothetical protein JWP82_1563 [Humibacillus sp.]|nr:hypothetical protein [Humibacillus sp.]
MRPTSCEFADAWPRIVRALASLTGSLDEAEEFAAEAVARAAAHDGPIESYAAWCTTVAKRAWLDQVRRTAVERRLAPELARQLTRPTAGPTDPAGRAMASDDPLDTSVTDELDDRLALLFVACDDALSPTSQMVLALRVVCGLTTPEIAHHLGLKDTAAAARLTRAKATLREARGAFRVPDPAERSARLPVVLACVAGLFTIAHRVGFEPADAATDTGRAALSIADALVAAHPGDLEVRGLRAVIRLGLARRPARVDDTGTALALDEVDRSRWDRTLLTSGLADATLATRGTGRFALEAAISGLHSSAPSFATTDWAGVCLLYDALVAVWPSPSVQVARLAARAHRLLAEGVEADDPRLRATETELEALEVGGPAYAGRDAALTLADVAWRTGRREEAARRYRGLAKVVEPEPVRRFCLRRAGGGDRPVESG